MICIVCAPNGRSWPLHKRGCPQRRMLDPQKAGRRWHDFYAGRDAYLAGLPQSAGKSAAFRLGWRASLRANQPT